MATLDTLPAAKDLTGAGFSREQAEVLAQVLDRAQKDAQVVTEPVLVAHLAKELKPLNEALTRHGVMLGIIIAGIAAMIGKPFFGS